MSKPPTHPFFERFDRIIKTLQGTATLRKKPSAPEKIEPARRFATLQDRVLASVIDMSIIYILLQDVFNFITRHVYRLVDTEALLIARTARPVDLAPMQSFHYQLQTLWETQLLQLWVLNSVLQSLVVGVILVLMWREFHTTLGKAFIGIEFAGLNGEDKPSTADYIRRFLGFYLSMPVFMVGFMLLGLDKQKRAWHDRIAATTVIYSPRGNMLKWLWVQLRAKLKKR